MKNNSRLREIRSLRVITVRSFAYAVIVLVAAHRPIRAQSPAAEPKPQLRLSIELPAPQSAPVQQRATFSGWAIDSASLISAVEISIDGVPVGAATTGVSRPEVCATYTGASDCPNIGWTFAFDASTVAPGKHTLRVTAKAASGTETSATREFATLAPVARNASGIAARADSTAPDFQLGINPSSLAIDTGGTGIATVQVTALGSFSGTVTFTCSLSGVNGATCAIPGTVSSSGTATLIINAPASIARTAPAARLRVVPPDRPPNATIPTFVFLLAALCVSIAICRRVRAMPVAAGALSMMLLVSCEDRKSVV